MDVRDLYEASYLRTNYRALSGQHYIDFRINNVERYRPWRLTNHLVNKWAFISSENPNSILLTEQENAVRSAMLLRYLRKRNLRYFLGLGIPDSDDWPTELGFFVININLLEAKRIGYKFQQNAIVFSRVLKPIDLIWLD
ncbi:MAG: DUF3293 domain-containing protein [Burkholderiales bacterium]|nr:DUF3293 domain-containing protein [Burkholderiales bacterium]OUT77610.1 MAG: hypothetical protein CBB82_05525 [Betaproteobacteria bacterium TMED22]|tara:strand:- start:101 stop:520 length:420 start_codon:yes stop_codon:yes gene_type:complete